MDTKLLLELIDFWRLTWNFDKINLKPQLITDKNFVGFAIKQKPNEKIKSVCVLAIESWKIAREQWADNIYHFFVCWW